MIFPQADAKWRERRKQKIPREYAADIGRAIHGELLLRVKLFQVCNAVTANLFAFERYDIIRIAAENTAGSVFLKNDLIIFYKDLNAVAGLYIQRASCFNGKNNSAQLINLSYNSE